MKVFEAVAEAVYQEGIRKAFVVLGHGNMESCIALRALGTELRSARHEAGAVGMAEGYALATKSVGFASVTRGPGLTQLGTPLIMAARNHVPIVVLTGDISADVPSHVQAMDQRRLVEAYECVYRRVRSAGAVYEDVREAFYRATVERRPVILSVEASLKDQNYDWGGSYRPSRDFLPKNYVVLPDEAALSKLVDQLQQAERPVIVVGRGAVGAQEEVEELGALVGAVILTTLPAKGFMSDREFNLGIAGVFVTEAGERAAGEADIVLAVGSSLNRYTLEGGLQFPNAEIVSVNSYPVGEYGDTFPDSYIWGDAKATLHELVRRLRAKGHWSPGFRTPEFSSYLKSERRKAEQTTPTGERVDGLLDPRAVVATLDRCLSPESWVVIGQGHYWAFPISSMRGPGGARFVVAGEAGAVGNALGTAIGFAEGVGSQPVVLVEGDGSLMMHLQELDTVVRYGTRLLILVMNDQAFGSELHSLRAHGIDSTESAIPSPEFAAVAAALGWVGVRADSIEACETAMAAFFADNRPYLIDARISQEVVSPPARRLEYGESVFCPLL